jgi:REP element-mobilizing transposase RayT
MSRKLRFIPEGGGLVEVTCRTLQSRFLLRPSPELNDLVVGVFGRAQRLYGVRCCALAMLSNHYHALLIVDDQLQLSNFMGYLNSNLARETGRLSEWSDKIWSRRYQAILVSDEEGAQVGRLAHILEQGVKESLVERVRDWPGIHSARALVEGVDLQGHWFDRTQEYTARRRGEEFDRLRYATVETLHFSPLPCWKHLPETTWRQRVVAMITDIDKQAAARRSRTGSQVLGPSAIRGQHPHDRPACSKRSPAPFVHAMSAKVRREIWTGYRCFVAAYRDAAEKLQAGNLAAPFPVGSFPPALPFVSG